MSRRNDDYEWLTSILIAIIAAFLALALFVASHGCQAVYGAYTRRGRSSRTLQALAVLAGAAVVLALILGIGFGAWAAAGLIAGSAAVVVVTASWLVTAVWDEQDRRALETETLNDLIRWE